LPTLSNCSLERISLTRSTQLPRPLPRDKAEGLEHRADLVLEVLTDPELV